MTCRLNLCAIITRFRSTREQRNLTSCCWLSENFYDPIPDMSRFVQHACLHWHKHILIIFTPSSCIPPLLLQVILMSATINCAEFAEYFGTPIRNQMNPAYVFEVEGAPYTIEEFYLDDLKAILPLGINVWEATKNAIFWPFLLKCFI